MWCKFVILVVAVAACVDGGKQGSQTIPEEPVVVTPSGAVRGVRWVSRRGRSFAAFRGVRYAEPPTGERRFQPPEPITSYTEEVDARSEGPGCPQPVRDPTTVDEDCLRLNVYTPGGNGSAPLPVIVYIHAGGFYSVSGRSDVAGPHYLMDRDIVFVTINYRLGALGFIATGDKHAPGNNGFKDQVAALRWVQRNIAAFGGDPNLVTIAGYSAGSFSVVLHSVSPMSKGLFHRAISMSGSPISQVALGPHQRPLAVRQARVLGCPSHSSKAIIDCLKTKTAKELGDSLDDMFEFGYDPILLWNAVVEPDVGQQRFLAEQPLSAVKRGLRVPYIVSQTTGEFFWKAFNVQANQTLIDTMNSEWEKTAAIAFLLPKENEEAASQSLRQFYLNSKPVANDTETATGLGKLYGDSVIGFGVHRLANLLCRHSSENVYYYEFAYIGNSSHYVDPVTKKPVEAAHHDDLIYLLSLPAGFPAIPADDSNDSRQVDRMTALWYNFARYGDPNPRADTPELSGLSWPAMTPANRQYLRVADDLTVSSNMFEDRFSEWEQLYPIPYGPPKRNRKYSTFLLSSMYMGL